MRGDRGVERNYRIEGHDHAGRLRVAVGGSVFETGDTAREWVGDLSTIRGDAVFGYFSPAEKRVLRSSFRASRPRRRARVLS